MARRCLHRRTEITSKDNVKGIESKEEMEGCCEDIARFASYHHWIRILVHCASLPYSRLQKFIPLIYDKSLKNLVSGIRSSLAWKCSPARDETSVVSSYIVCVEEIFPGQFTPSVSHRFIKELESAGRLLRNYTQNIDTLEHQTGIKRVVECHGSFSKNTCTECGDQTDGMVIRDDVLAMKVARYKNKVDLIVVIGSSLKVRPVALIPHCVGKDVPHILINRESLPHYNADIELLGNCDDIIRDICFSLGGSFAEMIASYDTIMEEKRQREPVKEHHPVVSRNKRQLISQQEFLNICLREKNGASESDDEPNLKRPRMSTSDNIRQHQTTFRQYREGYVS
ncbi:hypothetical protein CRE_10912 [Caenorhabditis remanei]|uniref:Deacetylase sirtuin-type domain-containing protein n=1 Tax=Caenorhabditis remanei TaxID=31234 RepID=E3M5H5_CAERE|nr:hypothetical protein CRE_10912 [Caenorhabditis remanei]